jgi:hypothetical protein
LLQILKGTLRWRNQAHERDGFAREKRAVLITRVVIERREKSMCVCVCAEEEKRREEKRREEKKRKSNRRDPTTFIYLRELQ